MFLIFALGLLRTVSTETILSVKLTEPTGNYTNGPIVDITEAPWYVSITSGGIQGGAILNKKWVLTVTKPYSNEDLNLLDIPISKLMVRSGSNFRIWKGCIHKVTDKLVHPEYGTPTKYDHNCVLLSVFPYFEFSERVKPIKMNMNMDANKEGLELNWVGLWTISEVHPGEKEGEDFYYYNEWNLTKSSGTIVKMDKCTKITSTTNSTICVKTPNMGSAIGDHGATLADFEKGIAYGANIDYSGYDTSDLAYSVFLNIAKVARWIKTKID